MRKTFLIILSLVPGVLFAQLDIDGKTEVATSKKPVVRDSHPFTIFYSATTEIPFGIKIQYCKSFGAYASFKSDFDLTKNHYHINAGAVKSLGKTIEIYLGGGIDFGIYEDEWSGMNDGAFRNDPCLLIESGFVFKIKRIALDLGIGVAPNEYSEYYSGYEEPVTSVFANFGLGFNF